MTTIPTVPPPITPYPVLVSFAERAKQRRWTVLLRIFLALPLAVVLIFFGIATFVVVVVGWFGALFMGRTPTFTRSLVTITLRLALRLSAYGTLLNDRFPSFALEDHPEDLVRMAVPEATRMNRWAVFFRIILVIPVNLLSSIVQYGSGIFVIFSWFAVLITGWVPKPIYDLNRAVIRFQIRVNAYFLLLVPTYPNGLFGDPAPMTDLQIGATPPIDAPALPGSPPASAFTPPPPPPLPLPLPPTLSAAMLFGSPPEVDSPPEVEIATPPPLTSAAPAPPPPPPPPGWLPTVAATPPSDGATHPGFYPSAAAFNEIQQPPMHPSWLLVLGKGGRALLIVSIVLGVPIYGGALIARTHNAVAVIDDQQLVQANNTLVSQLSEFATQGRACQGTSNVVSCVEANDGRLASQLRNFANTLSNNSSDTNISQSVLSNAESAANHLAQIFRQVSNAGSNRAAFNRAANVNIIDTAATAVLNDLNALRTALNNNG